MYYYSNTKSDNSLTSICLRLAERVVLLLLFLSMTGCAQTQIDLVEVCTDALMEIATQEEVHF